MKKKFFLLAILSGLTLSSCDALDSFFAESKENNKQVEDASKNDNSSNGGSISNTSDSSSAQNTGDTNSSSYDENNTNQTSQEDNNTSENTNTDSGENTNVDIGEDDSGTTPHEDPPPSPPIGGNDDTSSTDDEVGHKDGETRVSQIYFADKTLDLQINKYKYVNPTFITDESVSVDDLLDEEKDGIYASSNTSVATINEIGKVVAVGVGVTVITYTTTLGNLVASMTVYVHTSLSDIKREYVRLDDPDEITLGDELIFASPDFGVAASVNVSGGYIIPAPVTFSSDGSKILTKSDYVAEYYVGPGDSEYAFTFESQKNCYLACKDTTGGRKLVYSDNGKAQINWIVEIPDGYNETFIVSDDLTDDYWLMFNKVSKDDSDIRFNIYDSNEQSVMKKPIVYRKTIIRD